MGKLKEAYKKSKEAKVGELCICPSCKSKFIKTSYQQAFCKNKPGSICKDFYWNNVTPTKKNNTTRISPANAQYMEMNEIYKDEDFDDDQCWGAHKDSF
jgi:hypothetical protein